MGVEIVKGIRKEEKMERESLSQLSARRVFFVAAVAVALPLMVWLAVDEYINGGNEYYRKFRGRGNSSSASIVDLNTNVIFTGAQFIIQNNDPFDWRNVELKVNSKSGYILKVGRMVKGERYSVGAMQFTKSDGGKFNPFTHKPLNISIWCDTPKGRGFYYGKWE